MPSSRSHKKDTRSPSHDKKECRSRSSSSSSSSSDVECITKEIEVKNIKHNKHNKHNKHDEHNKHETSESSSSSSSECKEKYKLCDIYTYFRNRLLEDEQLMVAGSDSYICSVNNLTQVIPNTHAITCNEITLQYNVDNFHNLAPYYIRESGVYVIFNLLNTDSSCQFTIFVNGIVQPLTCLGTNSGAGQLVSRHMIKLLKDDSIVIRNYISTAASVKSNLYSGGSLPGNDISLLIMKIAPYEAAKVDYCNEHKFMEDLSNKKKKLFKKLSDKLVCDNHLMVKGFNQRGSFYNKSTQSILTESNVVFNETSCLNGLTWSAINPDQIKVLEDGVYKLFFLINTGTPGQFTVFVNGIAIDSSTQGSNKGAGQITTRLLFEFKKNDIITVKNHTSANGEVIATEKCGGFKQNISTIVTLFKIAPLCKPMIEPVDCKLVKHFECYYHLFKEYLLYNKCLQLIGSPAYISVSTATPQNIGINDEFHFSTEIIKQKFGYKQGLNTMTIMQSGIYDIFIDIITDQSLQLALFVNNLPVNSCIFGRDSGATRTLARQFVKLNAGDIISVKNYESHIGFVDTAENPGGNYVGQSCTFMTFLLSPCEEICEKPKK